MASFGLVELSQRTGVPPRTIRYYQSVGLLPKPERAGKEAVYSDEHLDRLGHIATMRARGLRLDTIREFFETNAHIRSGVADWLGLYDMRGPWAEDQDPLLDDAQLSEVLGDRRPEVIDDLIAAGYLIAEDGHWRVPDYPLFKGAIMLYDVGTEVAVSAAIAKLIRTRIAGLADEVIETLTGAAGSGYAGEGTAKELEQFLDRFRPAAWEAAGEIFAKEIERAIRELG